MMNRHDQKAILAYAEEKGEVRGLKKGVLRTAKNMLKDGLELERVARITQLPRKEILALR